MITVFQSTFKYRLIYIFAIPGEKYRGLLKIGMASVTTELSTEELLPNCSELKRAANERIKTYTNTAGLSYTLLHTELALKKDIRGSEVAFTDKDVHRVLLRSGINRHYFEGTTANEWFECDFDTAYNAIKAVKENRGALSASQITQGRTPIIFREEQKRAIQMAVTRFHEGSHAVLWNAKMRFGKTLSALQVVKEMQFKRTLIFTHRPVVDEGWYEDFKKIFYDSKPSYVYSSKKLGDNLSTFVYGNYYFVYFASIQDLRGSDKVGGKFSKNDVIFKTDWDFIIIDEAHEGTQTERGQRVIDAFKKEKTCFLHLSGTPFNLLEKKEFSQNDIYTWDYVMEQRAKLDWTRNHYLDSNPYEELPTLNIYTYDLGDIMNDLRFVDIEDKAFNFTEFFRTWTGDPERDHAHHPAEISIGNFVHEADVLAFLDLLCREDDKSFYPFSRKEYRGYLRHSLWVVPGVKEAAALSKLLRKHPIFQHFNIANVAGEGDIEVPNDTAMNLVREAMTDHPEETYSITLTVAAGRLTTGVTVSPWTAVFYLAGSYSTKASSYMQTIFRVQSPANIGGKIKDQCYVFDFAPDRTLNVLSEAAKITTKPGQTTEHERRQLGDFLNFCPVIGINGSHMKKFDTNAMLQQIKAAYVNRVVRNGFDDSRIYNDELLRLKDIDLQELEEIKGIVKASKPTKDVNKVEVNNQGLTDEEYDVMRKLTEKKKKELTEEEKKRLEELRKKQKQKQDAITILRAISIRIPLMVYGANIPLDKDVTIENFTSLVDPESWDEFMPKGITKQKFNSIRRFYDPDIFTAAGRQIRNAAYDADQCLPTERIKRIVNIFATFKNPDKETVLTPWRVVNMHMSDCLGGYDFYEPTHTDLIDEPRFVDQGEVTRNTLANPNAHILEINSKSGLYPLYVAYSIYRCKCDTAHNLFGEELTPEEHRRIWQKVIAENIFVVCKTEMAKRITRRTLLGYDEHSKANIRHFENLLNKITEKPKRERFLQQMHDGLTYWKANKERNMKFDAVVGNPPYQLMGGSGGNNDAPIYQHFADIASLVTSRYCSLVIPSRWFAAGRENLLGDFRKRMLTSGNVRKLIAYTESSELFRNVEIKGGVCYYLERIKEEGLCEYTLIQNERKQTIKTNLSQFDVLIREPRLVSIIQKVTTQNKLENNGTVDSIMSADTPFGIPSNPRKSTKTPFPVYVNYSNTADVLLFHIENQKRKIEYVCFDDIKKNKQDIDKNKVFIPIAGGSGNDYYVLGEPVYAPKHSVCSQSYIYASFNSEEEAKGFIHYVKTKFFRILVSAIKITQSAPCRVYRFVPLQDFTHLWTDEELYKKYKLTDEEIAIIESMIKPME